MTRTFKFAAVILVGHLVACSSASSDKDAKSPSKKSGSKSEVESDDPGSGSTTGKGSTAKDGSGSGSDVKIVDDVGDAISKDLAALKLQADAAEPGKVLDNTGVRQRTDTATVETASAGLSLLQPSAPATLADLWVDNAQLKPVGIVPGGELGGPGQQANGQGLGIVAGPPEAGYPAGRLYLFSRRIYNTTYPGCVINGRTVMGLEARMETGVDANGQFTWSDPWEVVIPGAATPGADPFHADHCAATDGVPYYDAAFDQWFVQLQCIGGDSSPDLHKKWNGCAYFASHAAFVAKQTWPPLQARPNIHNGELWSKICANDPGLVKRVNNTVRDAAGKPHACKVGDEGTFQVIGKDGAGAYLIRFHGTSFDDTAFDNSDPVAGLNGRYGFIGLARTTLPAGGQFQSWDALEPIADDTIISVMSALEDPSRAWRSPWEIGTPETAPNDVGQSRLVAGPGAGTMVWEDGLWYQLVEIPDRSLSLLSDQTWDIGLFRSGDLGSFAWDQPTGQPGIRARNPLFASGEKKPDRTRPRINYPNVFKRGGETFMAYHELFGVTGSPIRIFKLVKGNLLKNSDFSDCDAGHWGMGIDATLTTPRLLHESSDGHNCPAILGCTGASCAPAPTQSTYVVNDAAITPGSIGRVAFGVNAKLSYDGPWPGQWAIVYLQQFNGGRISLDTLTRQDSVGAVVGKEGYTEMFTIEPVTVDPATTNLRLVVLGLGTFAGKVIVDEAFILPQ